ncbi:MAG: hypothetical protein JSR54_15535 [Proteobacteria bacterium]|nr:hypothetical protein [Pseudomonadota bacterium]
MARLNSTLAARIAIFVLIAHLLLLPVLFFGLMRVVEHVLTDQFLEQVRGYARVVADEFEIGDALDSPERTRALLDSAILRGEGVYAEIVRPDGTITSALGQPGLARPSHQNLRYAEDEDGAYFLRLPIEHAGRQADLWLGFDERPTRAQIEDTRRAILWALAAYFALTMLLAVVAARRLARPLIELRERSRRVAAGEAVVQLTASTGLSEVAELGADLERMRLELVGVTERLRGEIVAREQLDAAQRALQAQLLRRQRLETVGTLAGGMAHEFNNALVPIILYTELLLAEAAPDSQTRADLESVLVAARRARDIVNKVLAFSRRPEPSRLEPVALEAVVEEAVKLFRALAAPNIEVRRESAPGTPAVRADAGLLVQLVMNLCTNAYQAMRPAGGVLTIGAYPWQSGAELVISDTGSGMDADTLERIFEPFFTTRGVGEGTGLGLAVAHGIASSFGATIAVESALGQGSTFRVQFPSLAAQPAPEAAVEEAS